jgi:hypothetical protein
MSFMLSKIGEIARSPGDPEVLETGPSSLGWADRSVRNLGWFSFALGTTELLAAPQLARWLGMEGKENLIRAYGARELGAGMLCLSTEQAVGAWSRVAGDVLDAATLAPAFRDDNPKKRNVGIALGIVAGALAMDIAAALASRKRHSRQGGTSRDYSDRSGFPKGVDAVRGAAARDVPADMHAAPAAVSAAPVDGSTSPATEDLQARERKQHPQPAL